MKRIECGLVDGPLLLHRRDACLEQGVADAGDATGALVGSEVLQAFQIVLQRTNDMSIILYV